MILSAAMMLDWLGVKHGVEEMRAHGTALREAVDRVVAEGRALTRDLGGDAGTQEAANAVADALRAGQ